MEHEGFLHDPKTWVTIAFVMFIALSYKKVSKMLIGALDARTARIKIELDEARRLREEAELVLADYKRKQAEYVREAEDMLKQARSDAFDIRQSAENELKNALDARMKNAMEKIAREEEKAIQEVRNHVVDIALAAARAVIVEQVGSMSQDELIKLAVADIERKIH